MFSSLASRYRRAKGASELKPGVVELQITPAGTSNLCKQCRNILGEFMVPTKDRWAKYWEFGKEVGLDFTQAEGCHLCAIVIDAIPRSYMDKIHNCKKLRFSIRGSKSDEKPPFRMQFYYPLNPPSKGLSHYISLRWCPEEKSTHEVFPSINCESNWDLARHWYETCKTSHTCTSTTVRGRPTRLVQLGAIHDSSVRLRESPFTPQDVEYCTLSHCWGSIPILTLSRSNRQSFLEAIPLQRLSKTFQDVIHAARRFGFGYIWIDSLCIIQDDPSDWAREATTMADVYAGSSLNFAATGASNGNFGCFTQRDVKLVQPVKTYLSNAGSNTGIYQCVAPQHWMFGVERSPLSLRAWVLQERVLAPRTLHFGRDQLHWECTDLLACESYPSGNRHLMACYDILEDSDPKCHLKQIKDPLAFWGDMIIYYTRCYLTKEDDKLVALSGLTRIIHSRTGDDFVAGLWRKDLEKQLLWKTRHKTPQFPRVQRAAKYRAPSWSWASIEGPIKLHDHSHVDVHDRLCCSVTDLNVQLASPDPFGQITFASLRLQCEPMKRAYANYGFNAQKNPELQLTIGSRTEGLKYFSFDIDPPEQNAKHEVYLLFIIKQADETSNSYNLQGLILQKTGKCQGEFQRVGQFYIFLHPYDDDGSYQSVINATDILDKNFYEDLKESDGSRKRNFVVTLL